MVGSNPFVAVLVAVILWFATAPMARKLADRERDPVLYRMIMWGLALHLVMAPVQIWVVDHFYHGITDYNRYVFQGAILGPRFDHFNFSLAGTNQKFLGAGSVSVFVGVVFALVGINKVGAFLVFGWAAFLGTLGFYRAFAVTFPEASHKRYAKLILFLPSLIFWTSGASKESVMYVSIGVATDGAARLLARRRGGVMLLALGTLIGIYVRPQELLLLLGCVGAATLFRPRAKGSSLRVVRFLALAVVQLVLLLAVVAVTQKLAKSGTPVLNLNAVAANNGSGQGSSIPYVSGPKGYPHDIYVVLFDPTPVNAHGSGQRVASLENLVIVVLLLTSFRRLRLVPRAALARPYVMVSALYTAGFCYAFAALSNLGLIDRERVLMLPFLLVLFAIPIAEPGQPKFPWELTRRKRREIEKKRRPRYGGGAVPALPPASSQAWNMRTSHRS